MKIAISAGHNVYVNGIFDPGATRNPYIEAEINKETVAILKPMLEKQGHTVVDVTPYNEKFSNSKSHHELRCERVDSFGADLFLDIHVNAGGGTGVEIWTYGPNSKANPYAEKIADTISKKVEIKNRGIKYKPTYWSVSLCKAPAMIIEGAFIDSKSDMEKLTPEKYARAIAKAFGEVKEDNPAISIDKIYKVQVGAFSVKDNAEKLLQELKSKGFNGFISESDVEMKKESEKTTKPLSQYYEKYGLKVIETNPDNVYVSLLPGKTLREFGIYGINGTWQNTREAHLPRSVWGLAGNGNKAIGPNSHTNSPNDHKRGTIIYYEDGTLEIKRINHIKEITKPFKWCIGGGSLIPNIIDEEKFASDIYRFTHHTGIGYKGNRIYLIVTSTHCSMAEFRNRVLKLELDKAIFLDGGGSTQMNYVGGKGIHSSRKLSHGVFLKKV
ncbi:N-acetylmuramoyl-L-alanine amidase [Clostridium sp. Cult1]|uniref:N-acetylmuramoyl-L-alanine amidase n=1 Tax=Clostridium sp. Cult1 TaxID=2079002 RepID=UPI001F023B4F|nr:N-acetylmuramoyl-L-alanine amidase [Clostridium sp. Cult1]MCF6464219.1 hypothetical protein [Clostridium sp. Cult1]